MTQTSTPPTADSISTLPEAAGGPRLPGGSLLIFAATSREGVPAGCHRFISVDGTVPGYALRWDHHVSGEAINMDAMPEEFDPTPFDGVATTVPDANAVASVVATLLRGKARLPRDARALLESASYWCDHLPPCEPG